MTRSAVGFKLTVSIFGDVGVFNEDGGYVLGCTSGVVGFAFVGASVSCVHCLLDFQRSVTVCRTKEENCMMGLECLLNTCL